MKHVHFIHSYQYIRNTTQIYACDMNNIHISYFDLIKLEISYKIDSYIFHYIGESIYLDIIVHITSSVIYE